MARIKVNLRRLPAPIQYAVAIVVASAIMLLAWSLRTVSPGPAWIRNYLLPTWQWVGVLVLFVLIVLFLIRRARAFLCSNRNQQVSERSKKPRSTAGKDR